MMVTWKLDLTKKAQIDQLTCPVPKFSQRIYEEAYCSLRVAFKIKLRSEMD